MGACGWQGAWVEHADPEHEGGEAGFGEHNRPLLGVAQLGCLLLTPAQPSARCPHPRLLGDSCRNHPQLAASSPAAGTTAVGVLSPGSEGPP